MSLSLDARQRAMLAEMGVRVWPDSPETPENRASNDQLALGKAENHSKTPPVARRDAAPASGPPAAPPAQALPPAAAPGPLAGAAQARDVAGLDWPALREAVAHCQACGLCRERRQPVFGVGDTQARWMVVGEAPGEQEDRQGEPFVGPSGQLLDAMLRAIGLDRHAAGPDSPAPPADLAQGPQGQDGPGPARPMQGVYIANVVKCRPPGNRNPQPDEVERCVPYLARQVALVRPRLILAMGRFAVQALLGTAEPLGRLRGRVHRYQGVPVIVTYHPAYLLRNLPEKARAWADLCLALEVAAGPPAQGEGAGTPGVS